MRSTLLPSLLGAVQNNLNQRVLDVALYELSRVYLPQDGEELPLEPVRVGGVITGSPFTSDWNLPRLPRRWISSGSRGSWSSFAPASA